MDVEFALLGPFEMRAGGRNVPMGGPKHRSLLAALLLRAGPAGAGGGPGRGDLG
ncbi:hypothetical protein [Actinomadura madurae]|uniref:hypothetical protein n=1 Tax=Actinomadura madurae TaxID=1993 RepID=UPI0020D20748|nr:hypothetical protein [Actinomadura madurae]MCQ0015033.1 hypothetical protein [Actinomadura madurae]